MKLVIESVPFESAGLPEWLERQLVGDHLGELIDELLAVRPAKPRLDFDAWFAPLREQILTAGLSDVPRATLRQLLADPSSLRLLQKAVLLDGGQFWDRVLRSGGFARRVAATRPRPTPPPTDASTPPPTKTTRTGTAELLAVRRVRRGMPVWVVLVLATATAAVAGLVVWLVLTTSVRSPG